MNKERAASYLGKGVPAGQVASIMGVSPGYIAQLLKEDSFLVLVEKHKEQLDGSEAVEEESISAKYLGLEHKLIKSIGDTIEGAELRDQIMALKVVGERQEKARTRKMPVLQNANTTQVVVQLLLPQHAIPQAPVIELNSKNEVVSIDSKPMAPMSSTRVEAMFKQSKATAIAQRQDLLQEL